MGGICYVPSRTPASEISGQQTGGKLTDLSLSLFNLTRQAALGTLQSIFKLTIYNQFSKGEREGVEESSWPCVIVEGIVQWEMIIQQCVVRCVSR